MTLTPTDFREILGHFPTGVVAITAHDDEPVGMTVGSFSSISLDPPLVGFFADRASTTLPRIERAGAFAVNLLGNDQHDVTRRFARKGVQRFDGTAWRAGHGGLPLLEGALAWIACTIDRLVELGDHVLVVGLVQRMGIARAGIPLVFHRGALAHVAPL